MKHLFTRSTETMIAAILYIAFAGGFIAFMIALNFYL